MSEIKGIKKKRKKREKNYKDPTSEGSTFEYLEIQSDLDAILCGLRLQNWSLFYRLAIQNLKLTKENAWHHYQYMFLLIAALDLFSSHVL